MRFGGAVGATLGLLGLAAAPSAAGTVATSETARPPAAEDAGPPPGPSVAERLAEIQLRVQRALVYPPVARKRGVEGEAVVAFRVGNEGAAEGVELARSSVHPVLDQAATRAVRSAGALPWVYGRLEIPVRFELNAKR